MKTLRKISLITIACGLTGLAVADELDMQGTNAAKGNIGPASGVTQAKVEATYGSPKAKKAAVGDPPISSWEYDGFVVFFEYDRVIHSVKKR